MYCKKCKKSYGNDALFCEECGERLIPDPVEKTEEKETAKVSNSAKSSGKSIAVRTAIGVLAVAVVGTGAFFGYRMLKNHNKEQQIVVKKNKDESKKTVSMKELDKKIDYRFLKSLAMVLPCYEEVSDMTEKDIINFVSTSLLYKNMQMEGIIPKNTDLYPILIDDKDVLQFDTEEPLLPIEEQFEATYYENISVKNTALNQAFAIMGYPGNWVDAYKDALLTEAHLNEESIKETINFNKDSIDVYTGGRGGFTNISVQIKDTKIEKKNIQLVYQYQFTVGEEMVTDEERTMTLIADENEYGYKIQSIVKEKDIEGEAEETTPVNDSEDKSASDANQVSENLFARMPSDFTFSSGVGAWGTMLTLHEDGTFEGAYQDTDMGDMEYANGTVYVSEFKGKFSQPEKIGDKTYKMNLESIEYTRDPGEEEVINDTHYVYTEAYGLEQITDGLIIYEPGVPADSLPEDCKNWNFEIMFEQKTTLESWGIYNPGGGTAFFGK